jgi:uncharacterized protein YydD (DUF2326 family)
MKLSKIYCNRPDVFEPISFVSGLNVVMAEIRLPENKKRDTHNLGKTTLGRLIDFCLLSSRDNRFFLFKHFDLFKGFIFFLELELLDGSFLTVRRGVQDASKISFKKHAEPRKDFTRLAESEWDHVDVPLDRATDLLDGLLDLRMLNPWSFRKGLGYQLRTQDDFRDVLHLRRFAAGHYDWKPYLAHILGFNGKLIGDHYRKADELSKKQETADAIKRELGGSIEDVSKIEGILLLKQRESEKKQRLLDAFDFRAQDKDKTRELVEDINERIARLNNDRYSLTQNRKRITSSLEEEQILFNPDEAENLFREAGILFQGQIKRDFQQLLSFNKSITDERRTYLIEERQEIETELKRLNSELNELGRRRSDALAFLSGTDPFDKYKQVTDELVTLRADITSLEQKRGFLHRLQEQRKEIRGLAEEKEQLKAEIEDDVQKQDSEPGVFSSIRIFFSEIIEEVIDRQALLSVSTNQLGHLEFKAEILDESGKATSADMGHTYKRLLCIAFDMAVVRGHIKDRFPRFIYHDGVFESLDDRKKENLLGVIRRYADLGIQHIVTLIDSDLPSQVSGDSKFFEEFEIVVTLHDEGQHGRLFKMKTW